MTVFVRNKNTGRVIRYALMGNVDIEGGRIKMVKDPRCVSVTRAVYVSAEEYEVIRITEGALETVGGAARQVGNEPRAHVYNKLVFEEV